MTQRALALGRTLAASSSAELLPYCNFLDQAAARLAMIGRELEALEVLQEAMDLRRVLHRADPESGLVPLIEDHGCCL